MVIRNSAEYDVLREGGRALASILRAVVGRARPGVTTAELDAAAESLIRSAGGAPAFKGYRVRGIARPFPATICTSVNDEVVHGIPSRNRALAAGDIVGIDIGMRYPARRGFFTDMAVTVGIGPVDGDAARLIDATRRALERGIAAVRPGRRIGDIGFAVQELLEGEGLGVVRDLAGHGVGKKLHEEPLVPNFGKRSAGPAVREGEVLAIEPMATLGGWKVRLMPDQWTIATADGSRAAHFEHTVIARAGGVEIITTDE